MSDYFAVSPDFCEETITYACIGVSGPDGSGGTTTFTGTEYPNTLCSLDAEDNLKVLAGPNNYVNQDAEFNMRPGTYVYTIEGTTLGGDTVTTTFTWTVIDPCAGQTLTMPALVLSPSEYTISALAQPNKVLPTVAVAPSVAAPQTLSDFCTLTYTFTVANPVINACLDYSNSPTTKKFDIGCDETTVAAILGTSVEASFTVTWAATLTSPYASPNVATDSTSASIKFKNPCADSTFAQITGADVTD